MKYLIIILGLMLMATAVFANGSGAGIANSPHDFSTETWNPREELCRTCHVPHDHQKDWYPQGLLWNHQLSGVTYSTYTFMDGTASGQPAGVSKLCLGCHDGTVGIDEFDKYNTPTVYMWDIDSGFVVPGANNAGDLGRTHPLSVDYVYDAGDADGLNDPATTPMGVSGNIEDVLPNGKVECSSCHDVHDNEARASTHLLRLSQKASQADGASALCLACHNK